LYPRDILQAECGDSLAKFGVDAVSRVH
jgi:hypothetical protein